MFNEHIPSYQLHMGQQIRAVPRDATTPRGPKLGCIPVGGMDLVVNDYIFGCVQRGAVLAYPVEIPAAEPAAQKPAEQVAAAAEPTSEKVAEKPAEQVSAPAAEPAAEKENV